MELELQLIEKMDKNDRLIREKYKALKKEYGNKYIAIDDGKVIASSDNLNRLKARLEKTKKDITTVLVQYIPKEGIEILY